jgi:hypothetical protein
MVGESIMTPSSDFKEYHLNRTKVLTQYSLEIARPTINHRLVKSTLF